MTEKGMRILIIEDDPQIRKLLKVSLRVYGYDIDEAVTGRDGINRAAIFIPDLIILDLGLPDIDGKEVVQQIREWSQMPIIILTARDQEQEKVQTLDSGADDYITKPFGVSELMARMRVSLRRASHTEKELILTCGDLKVDITQRRVTVGGWEVKLTPTEYNILKELIQHAGKVLTHKQLLGAIWGKYHIEDTHYIRLFISQLRHKIEENPTQPRYIISEPGVGYRLMCK
ncbi:two-component system response regulator [Anaerosporomusa subterranea]|uniref:Transcriptional regulatory protein KdpE n=1 Tax=Anaerosporomusa subterranea TaxID=1794912 RepID=A0A154BR77_ANASB|nr:response regulator [Anaerosporomusa subterranea]KYZ76028.1 two-component system response regulator [Anaerosporomusa subterranea]